MSPVIDIRFVPLDNIFVDFDWNSRLQARADVSDGVQDTTTGEAHGGGHAELVQSLHDDGQDTAVVLRPVQDRRSLGGHPTALPLELVCGFRRICAARETSIKNVPEGCIKAEVRELSSEDALLLNARENTHRAGLSTPDLAAYVARLHRKNISLNKISKTLGISRPYTAVLARIIQLPESVLAHWRGQGSIPGLGVTRRLTSVEMSQLFLEAHGKSEYETVELYKEKLVAKPAPEKVEQNIVEKRLESVGTMLGALVRFGVLQEGSLEWHRVVGPKRDGFPIDSGRASAQLRAEYWDKIRDAFEKGREEQ